MQRTTCNGTTRRFILLTVVNTGLPAVLTTIPWRNSCPRGGCLKKCFPSDSPSSLGACGVRTYVHGRFVRRVTYRRLAANGRHRAIRLQEARIVDAVARFFACNRRNPQRGKLCVASTAAQRRTQVGLGASE